MKNVIVANYNANKSNSVKAYKREKLELEMKAQIENNLELGWKPEDLWVVTNFDFSYMGINAIVLPLNKDCLTGSKVFAMRELFKRDMINDDIWIHDLDAWQNEWFDFPMIKDVGLAEYSRPKYNGGSMFYRPLAKDIIEEICNHLETNKSAREEPTLDLLLRGKYKNRTTTVNYTYNVGCSGFVPRYEKSIHPIKVLHMHPTNRIAWDTHFRGRNGPTYVSGNERLQRIFLKYFGDTINKYTYDDKRGPTERRLVGVTKYK
jgi:hypothetical protein